MKNEILATEQEQRITKFSKRKSRPEKPTYSPSRLSHYARCPRAFALSRDYQSEITAGTQNVMREGQLFEGFLFGFKSDKDMDALIGRKKADTIDGIRRHADYVRPMFETDFKIKEKATGPGAFMKLGRKAIALGRSKCFIEEDWSLDDTYMLVQNVITGTPYMKMQHETPGFIIRGETDYFGPINLDAVADIILDVDIAKKIEGKNLFVDLKYTGDIARVWDFTGIKEDYLQSIFYPYMHWKKTGEVLDFAYVVTESKYSIPIVRLIYMEIKEEDFAYVDKLVELVHNDFVFKPHATKINCLGGYDTGRCWFMDYCEHGRRIVGGLRQFAFGELNTNLTFKKQ